MLTLCHSTNLEKLADHLLLELHQNPLSNPLAPEVFVVQNHGIGQWLSLTMARQEGVAANLKFEFPAERMWSLARVLDPDIPQTLPSDRGPLTWSIMALLENEQYREGLEVLSQYSNDSDPLRQAVRRWKLSETLAGVFDQYLVFRPDLLVSWEKGNQVYHDNQAEIWQARLWRKLISHWKSSDYKSRWLHRARLQRELLTALNEKKLNPEDLPQRVTVFGVSGMPPVYIKTLVRLSKTIDVHFYQLNIDASKKEAGSFQNPLLQSLGAEGADFLSIFEQYVEDDPEVAAYYESKGIEETFAVSSDFERVRHDLIQDTGTAGMQPDKSGTVDDTLQVHSCHSPMREVEVLYDQLLAVFDKNKTINPEDVVIMTPDINTYAPMIDAVFGNSDDGQPEIPFAIADRGIDGAYPSIQVFLKLLDLCESRYKVTDVLDILDAVPLQETFEFSGNDLKQVEQWISDNRIRWGINGPFKQDLGVPETKHCTWQAGLDRMILGYAMKPGEDRLYNGIFPYHEIETSDQAELAGRLAHFLNALFDMHKQVKDPLKPADWTEVLLEKVDTFLPDDREHYRELSQIRSAIDQLEDYSHLGGYQNKIPFRIVRSWLKEQLEDQATGGGRMGRGVTFSSLVPMRSIPFKVVGMIGMNEGDFPRSKIHAEFDLMQKEPRIGDRSRANDDRYLLLENIMTAQSHLYFSYVGQSNHQDSDFPPSVVLKEFLDYMAEQYGIDADDDFIQHHPLQAFSPTYFLDKNLFSYSETQKHIAGRLLEENKPSKRFMVTDLPEPDEEWKNLSVTDLIAYYRHPAKFVLQKRVGIYLFEENVLDEDREPFSLGGLDGYQMKQTLLDRYLKKESLDDYLQIMRARDMLPQDWVGEQAYSNKVSETKEFGSAVEPFLERNPMEDCEVDLDIGGFHLVGKLSTIYEDAMVMYRYGRCRPKDQVEFWISHVLFQLVKPDSHSGYSRYIFKDKYDNIKLYHLEPPANPQKHLEQLLASYWEGLTCCSYFFPETSHKFAKQWCDKNKPEEEALEKAKGNWIKEYSYSSDGKDPYNKLMIDSRRPLERQKFKDAAEAFWAPYFKAVTKRSV